MKSYFECHITMLGNPSDIRPHVEEFKWKFSAIDGDPSLGDGIKCYATRHFNAKKDTKDVLRELHLTADFLVMRGINVIRRKLERIIFDDRSSTVQCNGACPECHLDDYEEPGKYAHPYDYLGDY